MAEKLRPIKKLGQNFLTDNTIARKMASSLAVSEDDTIIEIGPGLGAVTSAILAKTPAAHIFAVEIDPRYVEVLKEKFAGYKNFRIIHDNILDWLPGFPNNTPEFKAASQKYQLKVVGSLPYYITSPIIHKIIRMENMPRIAVLLVQKEVAEKICAVPPDASYMSSFVQIFYTTEYLGKVDRSKFRPKPQVDGAIIKLTKIPDEKTAGIEVIKMEGFLHKAYANPRKMLNKAFTADELKKAGIDGKLRPQNISPEKWLEAFKILID